MVVLSVASDTEAILALVALLRANYRMDVLRWLFVLRASRVVGVVGGDIYEEQAALEAPAIDSTTVRSVPIGTTLSAGGANYSVFSGAPPGLNCCSSIASMTLVRRASGRGLETDRRRESLGSARGSQSVAGARVSCL